MRDMIRGMSDARRRRLFSIVVPLVVVVAMVALAEGVSRWLLASGRYRDSGGANWFDSWEYVTLRDAEIGMVLRPGIRSRWTDVDIRINRSGARDASDDAVVEPKRDDEWLILSLGDSNTFGNHVPFEETYSERLERTLGRRTSRPVRVVNLGVPGYSGFQARLLLERYLHLEPDIVVFADCFNNRAEGAPDTRESLPSIVGHKVWELGHRISYTVLLASKQWNPFELEPLAIDGDLPGARVPLESYAPLLRDVVEAVREAGATPVFLATGDEPAAAIVAERGLDRIAAADWAGAEAQFLRLVQARPGWFLGWFYLYRAREELGRPPAEVVEAYARADAGTFYQDRFVHFARDYVEAMRDVARERGVPLVDMRASFRSEPVRFRDSNHYGPLAHGLIAEALGEVLADAVRREP
jgi:hypothetical protein